MIVESSFFKTLEALLANEDGENLIESSFVNIFSNCILQELISKNVDNPLHLMQLEKLYNYYSPNAKQPKRCDLYIDLKDYILQKALLPYSVFSQNWIEFKYFGNAERRKGNPTRVANIGKIANDLIRLGWNQYKSNNKNQGHYLIIGFKHDKSRYLAQTSNTESIDRTWVQEIFKFGISDFEIDLQNEIHSFNKRIEFTDLKKVIIKTKTNLYEPTEDDNNNHYSAYLIQLLSFDPISFE